MSPPNVEHKRKQVTALRSPLMKTLDRSVETLGKNVVTSLGYVHKFLQTRVALYYV